jgi:hypothetical protein
MLFVLIAKYLNVAVAIVLVARLLASRLLPKYRVLAFFLLYDLGLSLLWVALPWRRLIDQYGLDYRTIWLATRPLAWLLYIWVVYAILHKVMDDHPGILRTSRRIFAASFVCAVVIGLVSARIEYAASAQSLTVIAEFVTRAMIVERACVTTSLILLAGTLAFLLWFPVKVSRNIACLCAGLLAYFAAATAMLLLRDVWSIGSSLSLSMTVVTVHTACLLLWLRYLDTRGEVKKVTPGHIWRRQDQERLVGQLEAINAALIRSARR